MNQFDNAQDAIDEAKELAAISGNEQTVYRSGDVFYVVDKLDEATFHQDFEFTAPVRPVVIITPAGAELH